MLLLHLVGFLYYFTFIINKQNYDRFDKNLTELVTMKFRMENSEDLPSMDSDLATHIKETRDIGSAVEKLQEAITMACSKSFKTRETTQKTTKQKSVPLWTEELTVQRKRLNALRKRYQRTQNSEELRDYRKNIYHEEKTEYKATLETEKLKSWKEYCNLTPSMNPWNAVYKLTLNKSNCKVYAYIVKYNYVLGCMLFTIRKAQLHVSATKFGHHQVVQ